LANLRDLVRRIQSVKGTQQITKAMKMVAAAKLRRAHDAISEAKPWAETLSQVLANVAARTEFSHPLLEDHEGERTWVVVISSDKGLCGSFNTNILRAIEKDLEADRWPEVELAVVGRKASDYFRRRRWNLVIDERDTMSSLTADAGPRLGKRFVEAFTSGEVDSVWLAYNSFVNMIRQDLVVDRLLPIEPPAVAEEAEDDSQVDYLYEPDAQTLLAELLPRHVETQVQRALLDSAAAEQASRMTSMDAATRNAGDMIDALTMLYNRTRQAAITKELIEIVSGAQALEG
jgi:F-type H+-transporting ATPase subunit gamma